jgi:outer membrane protein TolC
MKHSLRIIAVGILSIAWPCLSSAQDVKPLSLLDAIQLALKDNRQLQAASQYRDAARSASNQAKAGLLPRVDLLEGFTYSDKPTLVFSSLLDQSSFKQKNFAIDALNEPSPLTNWATQIRLEQPLYTGGRLSATIRQATAFAEASEETARRTRQEVIAAVIEAYYGVLLAQGTDGLIAKSLASARAHLEVVKDLFAKGLVVRSDVLRSDVLVGNLEREKLHTDSMITISHTHLKRVMGDEEARYRLTEGVEADSLPVEALDELVAKARRSRPDLKAAEKEVERNGETVRVAQADYYPSLSFVSQLESNTRKFSSSGENFAVYLTAKWNLFNGFATQEKVAEAQALLRRAQLLRDDLLHAATNDVEESLVALTVAQRQIGVAQQNVLQAQESLRILKDRYQAGLARNVDILDGETALKSAEHDLLRAQVNSHVFRARLNLATGQL